MRTRRRVGSHHDDPLEGVANLFDLGVVFALGFMVALLAHVDLPQLLQSPRKPTATPAASAELQIIDPQRQVVERYRISREEAVGNGVRLGVAYKLAGGDLVYVPERQASEGPEGDETHQRTVRSEE